MIGIWGPQAREVVAALHRRRRLGRGVPVSRRPRPALGAPVLAQRISYVGELGFELYAEREDAVQVWDRLAEAGARTHLRVAGYRALDGLRIEKGYRYMGTDLTARRHALRGGTGVLRRLDKGEFTAREALRAAGDPVPAAVRTLLVGGAEYLTLYGGEAVRVDGATRRARPQLRLRPHRRRQRRVLPTSPPTCPASRGRGGGAGHAHARATGGRRAGAGSGFILTPSAQPTARGMGSG